MGGHPHIHIHIHTDTASSHRSLKPCYGLLSDAVLIRGYRRTQWRLVTAALGVSGTFPTLAAAYRLHPDDIPIRPAGDDPQQLVTSQPLVECG